jgi:UDP-glucose 4-epimerase
MTSRVLITGGFGYLGGRLAQFLASKESYEILLGSRWQNQAPSWLLQAKPVRTPWDFPQGLQKICSGVDTVVHLAGMNAQDCAVDSLAAVEVNAVATASLMEAAIRQKVKRFIYLSTVHVYGSPLTGVITEETILAPVHPYACSNQAGENIVLKSIKSEKIEVIVIRLSNAYGAPADRDTNCWMLLVNDLCRQVVTSEKLVLRSSGLQKRDFISLYDVVRAIKYVIELPLDKSGGGIFNLGGEASYRILDLAELIAARCKAVLGYMPEIERLEPAHSESYPDFSYQIEKLKEKGFRLSGNIENEIDVMLRFCYKNFKKHI